MRKFQLFPTRNRPVQKFVAYDGFTLAQTSLIKSFESHLAKENDYDLERLAIALKKFQNNARPLNIESLRFQYTNIIAQV